MNNRFADLKALLWRFTDSSILYIPDDTMWHLRAIKCTDAAAPSSMKASSHAGQGREGGGGGGSFSPDKWEGRNKQTNKLQDDTKKCKNKWALIKGRVDTGRGLYY